MRPYRRFIARDDGTPEKIAKTANTAKAEASCYPQPAKSMRQPAKGSIDTSIPDQIRTACAQVSQAKWLADDALRRFRSLRTPGCPTCEYASHLLASWGDGVAHLAVMSARCGYRESAWRRVVNDALIFMDVWAERAAALRWQSLELFGVHKRVPSRRLDCMGLVPLLSGHHVVALTSSEATIETRTGARQTYRRRLSEPRVAEDRVVLWELGRAESSRS